MINFFFFFFFLKFLADTCPFLGPLIPLFWISGDVSSGFQSQSGLPYSHCGCKYNVHSPRSTSSATLADLLAAGTQPVLSPHTVAKVRLLGFELCSQNICEPDALPTELNRDRLMINIYFDKEAQVFGDFKGGGFKLNIFINTLHLDAYVALKSIRLF